MMTSPPLPVPARFSADMVELRQVLYRHCMAFGQTVVAVMLAMVYLRRADDRLKRLFERLYAGTLSWTPNKPRLRPKRPPLPLAEGEEPPEKPKRMSRAFGWLCKAIRPDGYRYADRLRAMLDDPETDKLLAAGPQGARFFRPLCQMFGIKSDKLGRPKRPRKKPAPSPEQLARRAEREEQRAFAELGKTSSRKGVVPPGHTFPTNERDWAIYWGRVKRADQRRRGAPFKSA